MLTQKQRAFLDKFGIVPQGAEAAPKNDLDKSLMQLDKLVAKAHAVPGRGARLLNPWLQPLSTAIAEARKQAASGDNAAAARTLAAEADTARRLDREYDTVVRYLAEERKFLDRMKQARAHTHTGGAIAIADYLERLTADDKRRQQAEAAGDIDRALLACEAQEHRHSAMMQDAQRGIEFTKVRTEIEAEITRLETKAPMGGAARPIIAAVRETMEDAENSIQSDNWVGAVIMMRNARTDLKVGTKGLELTEELNLVEQRDVEYRKAFARVQATIAGLKDMPGAQLHRTELFDCAELLKQSRAALPDEAEARQILETARSACADLTDVVLKDGRFPSAFRQLTAQRDALKQVNRDKCVEDEVTHSKSLLRRADDVARQGDAPSALAILDEAKKTIATGFLAARCYDDRVGKARKALADEIAEGNKAEVLRDRLYELDTVFRHRDLKQAQELAQTILDTF